MRINNRIQWLFQLSAWRTRVVVWSSGIARRDARRLLHNWYKRMQVDLKWLKKVKSKVERRIRREKLEDRKIKVNDLMKKVENWRNNCTVPDLGETVRDLQKQFDDLNGKLKVVQERLELNNR